MGRRLSNILMVVVSVALCTAAAEFAVRQIDDSTDSGPGASHLDEITLAPGVERAWYFTDPPPLPNRKPISKEWDELLRKVEQSGVTEGTRRADMFKAWNANFVGDPCQHTYLSAMPGHIYLYDPPAGGTRPPYRFMPDATTPVGLVTNQYGFRGPPVPFGRQPKTVRIAFVGASTTVSSHYFPYSYPEFVGHWLNMWATAHKLGVTFEILNSGRESITSSDNVVIVKDEVLPLRPDLIVYYEGANQFSLNTVVPEANTDFVFVPPKAPVTNWWDDIVASSALLRRFKALLSSGEMPAGGGEWPKPDYKLVWPKDVDEKDPDVTRADLPVNLSTILGDLNAMRAESKAVGAEFVLASFMWLVRDGMVLDPIRHRSILEYLNQGYAPFRYRDMERLAAFQNRVYAKYAAANKLPFIDVARLMPFDPDLFVDAIHNSYSGERLRAWIFLQGLVPIVARHLENGAWPRTNIAQDKQPPAYKPRALTFSCPAKPGAKSG